MIYIRLCPWLHFFINKTHLKVVKDDKYGCETRFRIWSAMLSPRGEKQAQQVVLNNFSKIKQIKEKLRWQSVQAGKGQNPKNLPKQVNRVGKVKGNKWTQTDSQNTERCKEEKKKETSLMSGVKGQTEQQRCNEILCYWVWVDFFSLSVWVFWFLTSTQQNSSSPSDFFYRNNATFV